MQTREAVVFTVVRSGLNATYGCLHSDGTIRRLDDPAHGFSVIRDKTALPALGGPFAVFYTRQEDRPATGSGRGIVGVRIVDLRTGRARFRAGLYDEATGGATQLGPPVVGRDGSAAWSYGLGSEGRIEARDRAGRRTLDSGPGVAPGSVALAGDGHSIFWLNAGEPREARLSAGAAVAPLPSVPVPSPRCPRRGTRVIAQNADTVVFESDGVASGCLFSTGRIRPLVPGFDRKVDTDKLVVTGRYVGFPSTLDGALDDINLQDVRSDNVPIGLDPRTDGDADSIGRIVVRSNGAFAWTAVKAGAATEVNIRARVVPFSPLDSGVDVDADSLTASGDRRTLFWRRGGAPRSAPFG